MTSVYPDAFVFCAPEVILCTRRFFDPLFIRKLKNQYFEFYVRTVCQIPRILRSEKRPILTSGESVGIESGNCGSVHAGEEEYMQRKETTIFMHNRGQSVPPKDCYTAPFMLD